MASNRGYTTATKVRDALAGQVITYISDAMIDSAINRMEGVIDTTLQMGAGDGSNAQITWTTGTATHWVVEMAATYGAALQLCGPSAASWNTLEQLVNSQNLFSYLLAFAMRVIEDTEFSDFLVKT